MGKLLAITNQKGGVGKTTTAINLGASLAANEVRVLVVDSDPQGNATTGLGITKDPNKPSLYHVLLAGVKAADAVVKTEFDCLELIPADKNLVGANLRRAGTRDTVPELYADGFVTIDFAQRAVFAGDDQVALTPLEFRLLTAFVQNPNQVLSHEQLLELVWGDQRATERDQVKLYVGYLRRKLGTSGDDPIETVRGFGYRYRPRR